MLDVLATWFGEAGGWYRRGFVGCQRLSDRALPQTIDLKPESNKEAMGKKEKERRMRRGRIVFRRKTEAPPDDDAALHLHDLPSHLCGNIARYLSPTSRAFFATAMTASGESWERCNWQHEPSTAAQIIIKGEIYEEVNFEDFTVIKVKQRKRKKKQHIYTERVVPLGELTDGELGGMLVCINAVETVRSLKLTYCFGITGVGLQPLRQSRVLKRVDLCLVRQFESPDVQPEPALLMQDVIPVLGSIINSGESLTHAQFPKKWRVQETGNELFHDWLYEYNRYMNGHHIACSNQTLGWSLCTGISRGDMRNPWIDMKGCRCTGRSCYHFYGMQQLTCYSCCKHFCGQCAHQYLQLNYCHYCEKYYCQNCTRVTYCQGDGCIFNKQKSACATCRKDNKCWPKEESCRECWQEKHMWKSTY